MGNVTIRIDSHREANNILSQLPAKFKSAPDLGMMAVVNDDGSVSLTVPDEMEKVIRGADPNVFYPSPRVSEISDRQWAQALWKRNVITFDEARAFVKTGDLPPALLALIDELPEEDRNDAILTAEGAVLFSIDHPLVEKMSSAFGWDRAKLSEFWDFAASL